MPTINKLVLNGTSLQNFKRSEYVERYGLKCYNSLRHGNHPHFFEIGETIVVKRGHGGCSKYYCINCAKLLYLIE